MSNLVAEPSLLLDRRFPSCLGNNVTTRCLLSGQARVPVRHSVFDCKELCARSAYVNYSIFTSEYQVYDY